MADIWFISDTHFFHDNILRFAGRPFESVDAMNWHMVENWNSVVKPGDLVYHLGDVAFKTHEKASQLNYLLKCLNGTKKLLMGNHDRLAQAGTFNLFEHFRTIELWKVFGNHNFFASHIPLSKREFRDTAFQVHGHVHQNTLEDKAYINVSVENIHYTPVNIDWIKAEIARRM